MQHLFIIIISTLFLNIGIAQNLSNGDLIFVSSENSDFEKSIVETTKLKDKELNFTHVGIVNVTDTGIFVIEAVPYKGVIYTNLKDFETENKNAPLYIAKLIPEYQKYTNGALRRACSNLGKGYDYTFDLENDLFYCSELVYDAYAYASGDPIFFETPNMTFKKEGTDEFLLYWVEYFEKNNHAIPEGKPGINPIGLSRSNKLRITDY
ncbi:MAG: hypothetical protein FWH59_00870 [Lentimicrobiaceae bacterium]|nr:hypothetical protein [Lentimicrobiaceae bacterium]